MTCLRVSMRCIFMGRRSAIRRISNQPVRISIPTERSMAWRVRKAIMLGI